MKGTSVTYGHRTTGNTSTDGGVSPRRRHSSAFKATVALEAVKSQKTLNELASEFGVHPVQVAQWKRQLLDASRGIFRGIFEERLAKPTGAGAVGRAPLSRDRPAEGGSGLAANKWEYGERPLVERQALIEPTRPQLNIARQCELIGLARSRWYSVPCGESEENLLLMRLLDEQFTKTPLSGLWCGCVA